MRTLLFAIFFSTFVFTSAARAGDYGIVAGDGLKVAGDLWITFRGLERYHSPNRNFHGDDPFNFLRVRTFLVKEWNPKNKMTVEFLWDNKTSAPRVQGAYLTFKDLWGPWGARVGMIPSPFGNYGTRSTYFNQNPLIGVPAMWHYRTPFSNNGTSSNLQLMSRKSRVNRSSPIAYDACWDYGVEGFYDKGLWEFGLAGTMGTLGSMSAVDNNGYQVIGRVGVKPTLGMRTGLSFAQGPYIRPDSTVSIPGNILDYDQTAYGFYWEYAIGYWQLYSELMQSEFESPFVKGGDISNVSGYFEARWNFTPGWYLAERFDVFQYSEIPVNNDGTGPKEKWGYDFNRIELALGFRPIREGIIRLDYQGTFFDESGIDPLHLMALQFGYAF